MQMIACWPSRFLLSPTDLHLMYFAIYNRPLSYNDPVRFSTCLTLVYLPAIEVKSCMALVKEYNEVHDIQYTGIASHHQRGMLGHAQNARVEIAGESAESREICADSSPPYQ
jgi:hypothetical protein